MQIQRLTLKPGGFTALKHWQRRWPSGELCVSLDSRTWNTANIYVYMLLFLCVTGVCNLHFSSDNDLTPTCATRCQSPLMCYLYGAHCVWRCIFAVWNVMSTSWKTDTQSPSLHVRIIMHTPRCITLNICVRIHSGRRWVRCDLMQKSLGKQHQSWWTCTACVIIYSIWWFGWKFESAIFA